MTSPLGLRRRPCAIGRGVSAGRIFYRAAVKAAISVLEAAAGTAAALGPDGGVRGACVGTPGGADDGRDADSDDDQRRERALLEAAAASELVEIGRNRFNVERAQ